MRNQINLVRKGLEPENVCLTDSLLSKQTRMPVCVWTSVPGTLGCRGLYSPSQAVCRAGGGGAACMGWAPWREPQEPASSFLEPPGHMLAVALSVSGPGGGGGLSPSVSPGLFERPL